MFEFDTQPVVEVLQDYDGYFEGVVRRWVEEKGPPFRHDVIQVSAGPWRPYAVAFRDAGATLTLDFYSAIRAGFGELAASEVEKIKEML